jgi:hypothetical protein
MPQPPRLRRDAKAMMTLHRRVEMAIHRCADLLGPGGIERRPQFILDREQDL